MIAMPPSISLWTPDSEPDGSNFIVKQSDLDEFDVVAEAFRSAEVFVVDDHHSMSSMAYVYLYFKHQALNDLDISDIDTGDALGVARAISSALDSLKKYDIAAAGGSLDFISQCNDKGLYDNLIFCLEILIGINNYYFSEIVNGSIYGVLTKKAWWLEQPYIVDVINKIKKECAKLSSELNVKAFSCFDGYLNSVIAKPRDAETAHIFMSAYCHSLASHNLRNNYFLTALLLIHRSLDLYFTSRAIHHNLIVVARDDLRYHNMSTSVDEGRPRMYLYRTYFDYVSFREKISAESELFIKSINKKRNELLHTHGVDAISAVETSEALGNAGKIMNACIEWKNCKASFGKRMDLTTIDILEIVFSVKSLISPYMRR